ncbi:hypothetical protein N182_20970 [Sinorhizobium sp. GL2]|nr:hypothetical protein N182_20970 [Sinorhizobium sp. GL2]
MRFNAGSRLFVLLLRGRPVSVRNAADWFSTDVVAPRLRPRHRNLMAPRVHVGSGRLA